MTGDSDSGDSARSRQVELVIRSRLIDYFRKFSNEADLRRALDEHGAGTGLDAQGLFFDAWDDWMGSENDPESASYPAEIYSVDEYRAVCGYHDAWSAVLDAKADRLESLDALFAMAQWPRLRDAAMRAVAVFEVRGRLEDDSDSGS